MLKLKNNEEKNKRKIWKSFNPLIQFFCFAEKKKYEVKFDFTLIFLFITLFNMK